MCYNSLKGGFYMPKKMTQEEVQKRILDAHNGNIILVGNFKNASSKATCKCNKCGNVWETVPYNIYSGHGCSICANNKKLDTTTFKEQIKKLVGDEYDVIGEYKNTHAKIKIKHNKCGNIFEMTPNSFKNQGQRCPECMKKKIPESNRIPIEVAQKRLNDARNNEFLIIKNYNGTRSKAIIKHSKCGKEFECYPTQLIHHRTGCPFCYSSRGEDAVRDVLNEMGYAFSEQYRIPDCKNKRSLPFDFCVKNKNDEMLFLIEYQGAQHFEPKFGDENLAKTKINDKIKIDYCLKNKINLICIKFKRTTNYLILKEHVKNEISKKIPSQAYQKC